MTDIAVVMVTVDRSPETNYLRTTLQNLVRGGTFDSPRLNSFHLVDSGSDMGGYIQGAPSSYYHPSETKRYPNGNVAEAIHIGSLCDSKWILFLEDDIDVCADFLDSVGSWLDKHERNDRRVYLFGSVWSQGKAEYCEVALPDFFGTQAFAIRVEDGPGLSDFLMENEYTLKNKGAQYDLLLGVWSKKNWPLIDHFAVSNPSFVQHIGMNSVINPRNNIHTFPSWRGKDWSYVARVC